MNSILENIELTPNKLAHSNHSFTERMNNLKKLVNFMQGEFFLQGFVKAYIEDTRFIKREVIKREIDTPLALINLILAKTIEVSEKIPLGKVAVLMPKNSLGLTLAKAVVSSYLLGNQTIVYLPSQLKQTAPIYHFLLTTFLPGTEVVFQLETSQQFLQRCFTDPGVKAIVIYGDDKWIDQYWEIAKTTRTKLIFEGPGNDPMIVMPDSNIEKAVAGSIEGGLNNSGQSCSAFERFFVHEDIFETFCHQLIQKLSCLALGSPYDNTTDIGPIASEKVFLRIQNQLQSAIKQGAKISWGGDVQYCASTQLPIIIPTVLTQCHSNMDIVKEETFGPIFPIISFRELTDLIAMLDATSYGLNAAVYGTCPNELFSYLDNCHRNLYQNSTPISPENISTRLVDGGYRRSGFIWEQQNNYIIREGRRSLIDELCDKKMSARIDPLPMSKMQSEEMNTLRRIPGDGLKGKYAPNNVLGTLMHNSEIFGAFLEYWVTSKLVMGFSVREQELIILRMGFLYQCDYVWKHHVLVAMEFGINAEEIAALKNAELPDIFCERELALLKLTDELINKRTIRSSVWDTYNHLFTNSEWIALISLISQYVLFALTNNALGVEVEEVFKTIPGLNLHEEVMKGSRYEHLNSFAQSIS